MSEHSTKKKKKECQNIVKERVKEYQNTKKYQSEEDFECQNTCKKGWQRVGSDLSSVGLVGRLA